MSSFPLGTHSHRPPVEMPKRTSFSLGPVEVSSLLPFKDSELSQSSRPVFPEVLLISPRSLYKIPVCLFDSLKRFNSGFLHPWLFPTNSIFLVPSLCAKPSFNITSTPVGSGTPTSAVCQPDTHLQDEASTEPSLHCYAQPNSLIFADTLVPWQEGLTNDLEWCQLRLSPSTARSWLFPIPSIRGYSTEPDFPGWGREIKPIQWWQQSCQ